jgi:hypothetical protein
MHNELEDVLTCVCCQDLMVNPICLEPCLHVFCNDCYSSWEVIQRTWYVIVNIEANEKRNDASQSQF